MAFTQASLDALDEAIATGELSVEFEGKKVQYRSITELLAARDFIYGKLVEAGQAQAAPSRSYASFSKG